MADIWGDTVSVGDNVLVGGEVRSQPAVGKATVVVGSTPHTADESDLMLALREWQVVADGASAGTGQTSLALYQNNNIMTEAAAAPQALRRKIRTTGCALYFVHFTLTGPYPTNDWYVDLERDGSVLDSAFLDPNPGDGFVANVQQLTWPGGPHTFDPASHRTLGLKIASGGAAPLDFPIATVTLDVVRVT